MTKKVSKKTASKGTDLTLLTKNDVPAMLEKVTAQIAAIKGAMPDTPRTEVELDGFGYISKINDLDLLIKAHSSVVNRAKAYKISAQEVTPEGIKEPTFKLNGHGVDAWTEDIKNRAILVGRDSELKKFEKIKKTLESNLSAELKLANDLKAIQDLLTD